MTLDGGAVPATLGYRGYTHSCCISINHVVCHGIPSPKTLKDGDIVNIDVTPLLDGWHGDTSRMYLVGDVAAEGAAAGRGDPRVPDARHRPGPARRAPRRHRRGDPGPCRGSTATAWCASSAATASAACSTTRPRWSTPPAPAPAPSCAPGMFMTIEPMINLGKPRGEAARRRLDRGDPRQEPVGAVRALDRDHRGRLRDLHAEPDGARQAALRVRQGPHPAPTRSLRTPSSDLLTGARKVLVASLRPLTREGSRLGSSLPSEFDEGSDVEPVRRRLPVTRDAARRNR